MSLARQGIQIRLYQKSKWSWGSLQSLSIILSGSYSKFYIFRKQLSHTDHFELPFSCSALLKAVISVYSLLSNFQNKITDQSNVLIVLFFCLRSCNESEHFNCHELIECMTMLVLLVKIMAVHNVNNKIKCIQLFL